MQAHDEPDPSNSQAPRTLDCIYLQPLFNIQGGHGLLHLASNRVLSPRKVTVVPITQDVISNIERIAARQGMKGLKLRTKSGQIL